MRFGIQIYDNVPHYSIGNFGVIHHVRANLNIAPSMIPHPHHTRYIRPVTPLWLVSYPRCSNVNKQKFWAPSFCDSLISLTSSLISFSICFMPPSANEKPTARCPVHCLRPSEGKCVVDGWCIFFSWNIQTNKSNRISTITSNKQTSRNWCGFWQPVVQCFNWSTGPEVLPSCLGSSSRSKKIHWNPRNLPSISCPWVPGKTLIV